MRTFPDNVTATLDARLLNMLARIERGLYGTGASLTPDERRDLANLASLVMSEIQACVEETPAGVRLEVGKTYCSDADQHVRIIRKRPDGLFVGNNSTLYRDDGRIACPVGVSLYTHWLIKEVEA